MIRPFHQKGGGPVTPKMNEILYEVNGLRHPWDYL